LYVVKNLKIGEVAYTEQEHGAQGLGVKLWGMGGGQAAYLPPVPPEQPHLRIDAKGVLGEVILMRLRPKEEIREFLQYETEVIERIFVVFALYVRDKRRDSALQGSFLVVVGIFDPRFLDKQVEIVLKMAQKLRKRLGIGRTGIQQALVIRLDPQNFSEIECRIDTRAIDWRNIIGWKQRFRDLPIFFGNSIP
jgi:hypothetical protein